MRAIVKSHDGAELDLPAGCRQHFVGILRSICNRYPQLKLRAIVKSAVGASILNKSRLHSAGRFASIRVALIRG
jgi:hypothetical protein